MYNLLIKYICIHRLQIFLTSATSENTLSSPDLILLNARFLEERGFTCSPLSSLTSLPLDAAFFVLERLLFFM